jgi:hypothetical protein
MQKLWITELQQFEVEALKDEALSLFTIKSFNQLLVANHLTLYNEMVKSLHAADRFGKSICRSSDDISWRDATNVQPMMMIIVNENTARNTFD